MANGRESGGEQEFLERDSSRDDEHRASGRESDG
jgi:hypothetical protein